jgi:Fic family protein
MVYIRKISVSGKEYFVLSHNFRENNKVKKISKYLGKTLPPKDKLNKIKAKFESEIKALEEPALLSDEQKAVLENIRKNYLIHLKKLTPNDLEKLEEYILTNFTYNTNAIEGSKLTIADVMSVFEGATPEGKPLRDIFGAKNMRTAYNYIKTLRDLSQKRLLELHKIVMQDILATDLGKYRTVQVFIGKHVPPSPEKVPGLMKDIFTWYRIAGKKLHPFELGCRFHVKFEHIHPFRDGNGRVGRLIMNFPLLKTGFQLLDITFENRPNYYRALEQFHAGESNMKDFIDYAFNTYVKMAKERRWL